MALGCKNVSVFSKKDVIIKTADVIFQEDCQITLDGLLESCVEYLTDNGDYFKNL